METSEGATQLVKNKYNLHKAPEVDIAAKHTQIATGEKVSQDPLDRIQNYLNRFTEILERGGPEKRERNLDHIKGLFHSKYVVKSNEIPEGYFDNQRRLAREQGHGDIEINPQARAQLTEVIIADQISSLDKWIDYLASPDAPYADGLKYWTLRSVLNMAEYDKDKKTYPQRSKGTTKPFPDLNREALAYVLDAVDKKYQGQPTQEDSPEFDKLIQGENFGKLYAWAIEKVTPATLEQLSGVGGEWKKFLRGSDPIPLVTSLQGHGTNWCTAGESTARVQLQGGDFYVYYSLDTNGQANIPRVAIRMEDDRIAEVRGVADKEQNLDSYITPVVEEKLKEFPDGTLYQKRVHDMKLLTEVENRTKSDQALSKDELSFLYEIDSSIEGFGYDKDPRIKEIRDQRNTDEDMPIVFDCRPDQIARSVSQINANTKAYVGPLEKGIFDRVKDIDHVYTSFPERKIRKQTLEVGGKSGKQLEEELRQSGMKISTYAEDMLKSKDFVYGQEPENIDIVRLTVGDLGFDDVATTDQIYAKAQEFGLDLCSSDVGPQLRLNYKDQPMYEYLYMGMKQIADRDGDPDVFELDHGGGGLWLDYYWAGPDREWGSRSKFVFTLRKSEPLTPQPSGFLNRLFKR